MDYLGLLFQLTLALEVVISKEFVHLYFKIYKIVINIYKVIYVHFIWTIKFIVQNIPLLSFYCYVGFLVMFSLYDSCNWLIICIFSLSFISLLKDLSLCWWVQMLSFINFYVYLLFHLVFLWALFLSICLLWMYFYLLSYNLTFCKCKWFTFSFFSNMSFQSYESLSKLICIPQVLTCIIIIIITVWNVF